MTDKTKKKILLVVMGIAFILFVISSVVVLALMWINPDMTHRQIILNYPIPGIIELVSAVVMTINVIFGKVVK